MNLLNLSNDERVAKHGFHSLTINADGNEVLIGLTREESEWMVAYDRAFGIPHRANSPSKSDKQMHVALMEKHEIARLTAIGLAHKA